MSTDPYPNLAWLREHVPVSKLRGGEWFVTGYADARACLADARLSHDDRHGPALTDQDRHAVRDLLDMDPPDHSRLRRLLAPAFGAAAVGRLTPAITRLCDAALDRVAPHGTADLVRDFAVPVPIAVIHELLGAGGLDYGDPAVLLDVLLRGGLAEPRDPDAVAAAQEHVERIVSSASGGLTGALQQELGDDELRSMVFTVLVAGSVTTVGLIGCALAQVLASGEEHADLMSGHGPWMPFLDEVLRFHAPVQSSVLRYPKEDVAVGDTTVPCGAAVVVSLASANRDPAAFERADTFDPARGSRGGLAFGHGPHRCLGDRLTRVEAKTALRAVFGRLADVRPREPVTWSPDVMLRGPAALPVTFSQRERDREREDETGESHGDL